jgi:hypothetical protein
MIQQNTHAPGSAADCQRSPKLARTAVGKVVIKAVFACSGLFQFFGACGLAKVYRPAAEKAAETPKRNNEERKISGKRGDRNP